jgi:hypothetical protein
MAWTEHRIHPVGSACFSRWAVWVVDPGNFGGRTGTCGFRRLSSKLDGCCSHMFFLSPAWEDSQIRIFFGHNHQRIGMLADSVLATLPRMATFPNCHHRSSEIASFAGTARIHFTSNHTQQFPFRKFATTSQAYKISTFANKIQQK